MLSYLRKPGTPAFRQGFRQASMKRGRRIAGRLTDTTEMERHSSSVDLDQRTCPHWVKLRNTQPEQMFSSHPPEADIDRGGRHVSNVPEAGV
jgi:hypothetical protein